MPTRSCWFAVGAVCTALAGPSAAPLLAGNFALPASAVPIGADPIFHDGFEDADQLADLFPADLSRWTAAQIEPLGNEIALSAEVVHGGLQSLRCLAQPYNGRDASKADIVRELLTFADGDEAWFELWIYLVGGGSPQDVFLWDLEAPDTCTSTFACPEEGNGRICNSPGRRLYLSGPFGWIKSDLGKWCVGEDFEQDEGAEVPLPLDRWVRLRVFIRLSDADDGVMRVWQDDVLLLDAVGITLPRGDSIYSRLQVGLTANGNEQFPQTLYLDDVSIWAEPPAWWHD